MWTLVTIFCLVPKSRTSGVLPPPLIHVSFIEFHIIICDGYMSHTNCKRRNKCGNIISNCNSRHSPLDRWQCNNFNTIQNVMPATRIMLSYSIKGLNVSTIQVLFIQVHWVVYKYTCLSTFMSLDKEKSEARYSDKLRAQPSTDTRISEVGTTLVPKRICR